MEIIIITMIFHLEFRILPRILEDARTFSIHTPDVIPEDGENRLLEASIPVFKIVQHLENFGVFSAASLKFRILLDTTLRGWVTAHRRFGRKQFPHLEWPIASIILICTVV